ncbi:cobalt-precorrin-6A reductase [Zhongshania aliphaticivorans]|uniref:cobalt-precorrin-6A reductase n=1 Tax=Zhongshania aliphaticivorans TaxID=1470434 RepID=UPI0012E57B04|nr:cobalt-precorrin-6A reductase [Zhongshania aliphaticivorans]CAA0096671.1 Precorrin-6A reductase [Zhongshania aliphaticivorans]
MHVLILGGTRDAMNLAAELLARPHFKATYSLAGRTRRPLPSGLPTRRGGFGGPTGLADWIKREGADVVVDATHPFAAQMSDNAIQASEACNIPLARLDREPWQPQDDDRWHTAPDLASAAAAIYDHSKSGDRILLATGGRSLSHFEHIKQRHFTVRCVDAPEPAPKFDDWALLTQRGPFKLEDERQLLREHRIDMIVCKNSGGSAADAKLQAARELGLPVLMVQRPNVRSAGQAFFHYLALVDWLESLPASSAIPR